MPTASWLTALQWTEMCRDMQRDRHDGGVRVNRCMTAYCCRRFWQMPGLWQALHEGAELDSTWCLSPEAIWQMGLQPVHSFSSMGEGRWHRTDGDDCQDDK